MIFISFDIGVKNLALCVLRHTTDTIEIIDWNVITLADKKKQIKGVNNIAEVLFYELDNIVGKLDGLGIKYIDKVIIENQPSNLNGIMKTIQHLIFSYFDLLRHWDKIVGEVVLINPTHKLQNHTYVPSSRIQSTSEPSVDQQVQTKTKTKTSRRDKYKNNKQDSIEVCKYYIRNDTKLQEFFGSHKKKDDLADTCLQTVSYIRKNCGGSLIEDVCLAPDNVLF
jgi:hypothetical protein